MTLRSFGLGFLLMSGPVVTNNQTLSWLWLIGLIAWVLYSHRWLIRILAVSADAEDILVPPAFAHGLTLGGIFAAVLVGRNPAILFVMLLLVLLRYPYWTYVNIMRILHAIRL